MLLYHRGRIAFRVRHGDVSCPARRCARAVSAGARRGARRQSGPDARATPRRVHTRPGRRGERCAAGWDG
ncbi:uncharacterized protein BCN122_III0672 [Burkholderia cenocepacia]|nr:uncharacterized protein BCN122_III0672 [Burkholderia cenocepacia]